MRAKFILGISAVTLLSIAGLAITYLQEDGGTVQPTGAAAVQQQMPACTTGSDLAVTDHAAAAPQAGWNPCDRHRVVAVRDFARTKLSFRWR